MQSVPRCLAVVLLITSPLVAGTTLSGLGDPTSSSSPNVIDGAAYSNVGALQVIVGAEGYGCSATLIGDGSWLLTAGHCVDGATPGSTTFSLDSQVGVSDADFFLGSQSYGVSEIVPHPKWNGSLTTGYDIALIRLATPIAGVTPAEIYTQSDERGKQVEIVGYGMYGNDIDGTVGLDGNRRAGLNVVDNFWRTGGKSQRLLALDFDNGQASAFGSTTPESTELFSVFGDSGGPVFIGNAVAGVNSFLGDGSGDGIYGNAGDYSGHTRVSEFVGWITEVTGASSGGGGGDDTGDGGPPKSRGGGRFNQLEGLSFTAQPISLVATASVPEPGSSLLLVFGAALSVLRFRARRADG